MEVRSAGPAGLAGLRNLVSPVHLHALYDLDGVQVGIHRLEAEPVVDDHTVAVAEKVEGDRFDHPVSRSEDRIADLHREIDSGVSPFAPVERIRAVAESA